jgi:hypothetical protein
MYSHLRPSAKDLTLSVELSYHASSIDLNISLSNTKLAWSSISFPLSCYIYILQQTKYLPHSGEKQIVGNIFVYIAHCDPFWHACKGAFSGRHTDYTELFPPSPQVNSLHSSSTRSMDVGEKCQPCLWAEGIQLGQNEPAPNHPMDACCDLVVDEPQLT